MRRRHVLAAAGVLAGTAVTGRLTRPAGDDELLEAARGPGGGGEAVIRTETILPDTDHETTLYEIDAPADGPTAMVFGGVHGDERNGIDVASEVTEWHPDSGTLVVVPETNRVAVENDTREGGDGDLNRHFPVGGELVSDLARGIWDAVERHRPDVVLDLHRSLGIYGVHRQYVGQAIFHSPNADGDAIADYLDDVGIPWYMPLHRFTAVTSATNGSLLFHRVHRELGAIAYLFETTAFVLDRDAMVELTRLATAAVLEHHGLLEREGTR